MNEPKREGLMREKKNIALEEKYLVHVAQK